MIIAEQFDLFASKAARDKGTKIVADHNKNWMEQCLSVWPGFHDSREGQTIIGEDFRAYCESLGLHPKHHNAWGALIMTLVKRGMITATSETRQMKDKRSHARKSIVYLLDTPRTKT